MSGKAEDWVLTMVIKDAPPIAIGFKGLIDSLTDNDLENLGLCRIHKLDDDSVKLSNSIIISNQNWWLKRFRNGLNRLLALENETRNPSAFRNRVLKEIPHILNPAHIEENYVLMEGSGVVFNEEAQA